ncbi:MAG TPA: hypothetical protein VJJ83_01470 [Candidatus Babeliales bacterium]|nr:hypothetical protein [Candidatus Babeliales bacterium]
MLLSIYRNYQLLLPDLARNVRWELLSSLLLILSTSSTAQQPAPVDMLQIQQEYEQAQAKLPAIQSNTPPKELTVTATVCPTLYQLVQDCALTAGLTPPTVKITTDQRTRRQIHHWAIYFDRGHHTVYIGSQLLTTLNTAGLTALLLYQLHDRYSQSSAHWDAADQVGYFLTSLGSILTGIIAVAGIVTFVITPIGLFITLLVTPHYPLILAGLAATSVGLAYASATLAPPLDVSGCLSNPDDLEQALNTIMALLKFDRHAGSAKKAVHNQQLKLHKYIAYHRAAAPATVPMPIAQPRETVLAFETKLRLPR